MKRIYLLLLFICSSLLSYADGMTATLQHGDEMTFYLGASGLQSAYEAAVDDDVITLSSGQFTAISEIKKSIRIVGAYGMNATDSYGTFISGNFTINANNVKLEGMYFQADVTIGEVSNCTIKRCFLSSSFKQSGTHTNTLLDQCVVYYDYAIATGVNYSIKNSTVYSFSENNTASNVANITNCFIHNVNASICAIYKNNVLRSNNSQYYSSSGYTYTFKAPSEFYNNYFYITNSYTGGGSAYNSIAYATGCIHVDNTKSSNIRSTIFNLPDTTSFNLKGGDGTPIGMNGGEGYNQYPGIPRVTSATIDAQTDDKGMLNASLTVKAEK